VFTGRPARALRNRLIDEMGDAEALEATSWPDPPYPGDVEPVPQALESGLQGGSNLRSRHRRHVLHRDFVPWRFSDAGHISRRSLANGGVRKSAHLQTCAPTTARRRAGRAQIKGQLRCQTFRGAYQMALSCK
jgi:hypothetical protein